jgi:hypothetical protein
MRTRLVTTSRGPVQIGITESSFYGTQVTVTTFGADGWADDSKGWTTNHGYDFEGQTLANFLMRHAELPLDESEELAQDVLGPWVEHWVANGGREEAREIDAGARLMMLALGVVVVLALVGVGSLVVVLVRLL